ncbi:MAG: ATP-binding protein [Thermoanaerobaculia bacterium]|nr:ATP-binding protein [Thermoanaerobaculia bacterium]
MRPPSSAFEDLPADAGGHFVLNLYAAIFRLVNHLRQLAELSDSSLEQAFERFPFLGEYFLEMRPRMPEGLTWSDGIAWWREQILVFEGRCEGHLPLLALDRMADLDEDSDVVDASEPSVAFAGRLAFMAIGLVEEDSRFGTVFAELQQPLDARRPTLELAGQMMLEEVRAGVVDPWSLCRPLLGAGFVQALDRRAPRAEWVLRVPPLLWDAARGRVEARPANWARHRPRHDLAALDELIVPEELRGRLERLPDLLQGGRVRSVILRCDPGSDALEIHGAIAKALGCGMVALPELPSSDEEAWRLLGPLCTMTRSLPVIRCELGPGETAKAPDLEGYEGPVGFVLGSEGGLDGEVAERNLTLRLPPPRSELRHRIWSRALGEEPAELGEIAARFHLSDGYIRRVARMARASTELDGRQDVALEDVRRASRTLNRQLLDTLASRLDVAGSWSHLVTADTTGEKLFELERRCRHRERLLDRLGPAFGTGSNRGVRALMTGPSGTGKTLAAKILAAELGMDLYRVDLAAVINKYIGETEKNLHRVLSRAEALDVVLLLDEGDALLGHRTEVRSANDRYANLETNYLLQRLEHYQGIVLVTTNLGDNIDPAFQRRMDVVIPFFPPQADERLRILGLHLPMDHRVDDHYLEQVAVRCTLHGGQLRNAALHAALLALDDGSDTVSVRHLDAALRSEYRKAGGTFPLDALPTGSRDGGFEAFAAALGGN